MERAIGEIAAIPDSGFTFGLLRHIAGHPLGDTGSEVLFNYLGRIDSTFSGSELFTLAETAAGQTRHAGNQRPYLIEIDAEVHGGELVSEWRYSRACHKSETVRTLAARWFELIAAAVAEF